MSFVQTQISAEASLVAINEAIDGLRKKIPTVLQGCVRCNDQLLLQDKLKAQLSDFSLQRSQLLAQVDLDSKPLGGNEIIDNNSLRNIAIIGFIIVGAIVILR